MTTPCYICGKGMESVRLDPRDMKSRPCTTCENVISEMVGGEKDEVKEYTYLDWVGDLIEEASEATP